MYYVLNQNSFLFFCVFGFSLKNKQSTEVGSLKIVRPTEDSLLIKRANPYTEEGKDTKKKKTILIQNTIHLLCWGWGWWVPFMLLFEMLNVLCMLTTL
jgi:hypothetical protein